jgi:hypothetical protein
MDAMKIPTLDPLQFIVLILVILSLIWLNDYFLLRRYWVSARARRGDSAGFGGIIRDAKEQIPPEAS